MPAKIKTAFRPAIETIEGRILATAGLAAAGSHGQSWVEIANQSGRNLSVQVSFNEGRTYSTLTIRKGGSAFSHVNGTAPDALIRLKGETPSVLATGTSKRDAPIFTITSAEAGGPILGGGGGAGVGVGGGSAAAGKGSGGTTSLPQTFVVLLNQSGGDVSLSFTNNNGRNFRTVTIGSQFFSLKNPFIVSLDQTLAGIKILRPNGGGLQPLASSPSLNSAPVYIINVNQTVFRS